MLFFSQVIFSLLLLWLRACTWIFFHIHVCLSLGISVCPTGCCFWWEIITVVLFLWEITLFFWFKKKNLLSIVTLSSSTYFFYHVLFVVLFFSPPSFPFSSPFQQPAFALFCNLPELQTELLASLSFPFCHLYRHVLLVYYCSCSKSACLLDVLVPGAEGSILWVLDANPVSHRVTNFMFSQITPALCTSEAEL